MPNAGYRREVDLSQLGPVLLIASSLILAIRTSRWPRTKSDLAASPELEHEIEQSIMMTHRIFAYLLTKSPFLFPHKDVPIQEPDGTLPG
jgi:hypothetical protein